MLSVLVELTLVIQCCNSTLMNTDECFEHSLHHWCEEKLSLWKEGADAHTPSQKGNEIIKAMFGSLVHVDSFQVSQFHYSNIIILSYYLKCMAL